MAALRALNDESTADMVELLNKDPVALSPIIDEAGRRAAVEDFRGKVVIINLWAPWCAPCLKEMPSLDRLAARLPDKDFAVVAVTKDPVGDTPSKRAFAAMKLNASSFTSTRKARSNMRSRRAATRRHSSSGRTGRRSLFARAKPNGIATRW